MWVFYVKEWFSLHIKHVVYINVDIRFLTSENEIMNKSIGNFISSKIPPFFEALMNLFVFFPYFFSVGTCLRTLFSPWKGLTVQKKKRGFSFEEWFSVMSFNIVSRGIGFIMRFSLIIVFFVFVTIYVLLIPIIIIIYFLLLPFVFFMYLLQPSQKTVYTKRKTKFVSSHALKDEHKDYVSRWFDYIYHNEIKEAEWWKLDNLFHTIPLAKDWAVAYTPKLDDYSTDLTAASHQTHIKHVIRRQKEIQAIQNVLLKSREANAIIVGLQGVGKSAIIDALAQQIFRGTCHPLLKQKRILKLNMSKILTTYNDPQEREYFFKQLLKEAAKAKNIIVMIDNIDRYISSGEQDRFDLSDPLQEFGKRSDIQILGITKPFNYDKYVFFNESIKNLFNKIDVYEISKKEAMQILLETVPEFEKRYKVIIPLETLNTVVEKSDFFITDIPFPEKALRMLDSMCVYTNERLKQKLVLPEYVDVELSTNHHVISSLNDDMKKNLLSLEEEIGKHVFNQSEAVHEISTSMRRAFLLLGKRRKPLTSFLFLGPTGVGKTETAKAIARVFFSTEDAIARFDMSLYQSKNDIPKLVGSMEQQYPGLLTTAVRERPYGVLLLDEIEKADRDLLNVFLTILDEGYFTDGFGKLVDCKNLIIIATSNAGANFLFKRLSENPDVPIKSNELIQYLIENQYYTPEFLNRFDGVVAFNPIQGDSMILVARKMLGSVQNHIFDLYKVKLEVSDETLLAITKNNFNPAFGARNLDRILRQEIEDKVAKLVLANEVSEGDTIRF